MNFKGKYTIIKRNKNGNVLEKKSQYNKITDVGKNIVLNLFKNASSDDNFNQMDGYQPLDLSTYKIKPLFKNPNYRQSDQYSEEYVNGFQYRTSENNTIYYDYQTRFQFDNENDQNWDVRSSLFFDKSFEFDGVTYSFVSNNITPSQAQNERKYIDYTAYDSHLTNSDNNAKKTVDLILTKNNNISFTWSGFQQPDSYNYYFFTRNIHNIDFFLVNCKQRIVSRRRGLQIPLWNGMNEQLKKNNIVLSKPKVKFRYSNGGPHSKNLIVLQKQYNTAGDSYSWKRIDQELFEVNQNKMTITFTSQNFSNGSDPYTIDQFMVFYNVYYLDDRLQNGICGMYLNYSLSNDQQTKTTYCLDRMLFGNGVFSYDGFKTLDDKIAFPWQGKPIKLQKITSESHYRDYYYAYNYFFNNRLHNNQNNPTHKIYTTSQYIDYIPQRFYSFYPYVTQRPTNFVFMLALRNNRISIKNFVFLVPKLRTTAPRVFVFGNQELNQVQQQKITNQLFRLDALQCDSQTTKKDQNNNDISLITWKTFIDYNVGNGCSITQLGLACGKDILQENSYGWRYIKPINKQQCNQLFSKIVLQEAVQKNQQQALEVIYELVVQ